MRCGVLAQERADGTAGLFDLPERVAAVGYIVEMIEGADSGQLGEFLAIEGWDAQCEIFRGEEGAGVCAGGEEGVGGRLAESAGIHQSEAEGERGVTGVVGVMLDGAEPLGFLDVDGKNPEAVALRIFNQHGGRVEAHRLIVEDGAGKGSEVVHLEVSRCVSDEGEAGGVGFGESVESE